MGCESMLDLFENGNYRRRRRRRNVKKEHKEQRPSRGKSPSSPDMSSMDSALNNISSSESKHERIELGPRLLEPRGFAPNSMTNRQNLNSSSLAKSDSEIKFSIDYILSAPDPLPVLRSQYNMQENKYHLLEAQQINLQFWTMWHYLFVVTKSELQCIQQPHVIENQPPGSFFSSWAVLRKSYRFTSWYSKNPKNSAKVKA